MSDRNEVAWPPEEHGDRLRRYAYNEQRYRGEHAPHKAGDEDPISIPSLATVTDVLSSRLFGEGVEVSTPTETVVDDDGTESEQATVTQEFVAHAYARNGLQQTLVCGAQEASFTGDAIFQVRYDADRLGIVIERIDPATWFPETDPLDRTRVVAHVIGQVIRQGKDAYLWQTRHEMRGTESWITNRAWILNEGDEQSGSSGQLVYDPARDEVSIDRIDALAGIPPEQPTGIDELLVVHIPNRRISGDVFGADDYERLMVIADEIDHRVSQRSEVLDKFVDPMVWGPPAPIDAGHVDMLAQKYLEVMPDSATPPAGTIVWDAQLTAVVEHVRHLTEQFAAAAGLDLTVLVPQLSGGPASGRALKLSQMRTQSTVKLRQQTWEPGLQRIFSVATKLASLGTVRLAWQPSSGAGKVVPLEPEDIAILWQDGLPADTQEEIDEQTSMVEAGLQSKRRAIMALHGVSAEEAQAILDEIAEEGSTQAHSDTASGMFGNTPVSTGFLGLGQNAETVQPIETPLAEPIPPQ